MESTLNELPLISSEDPDGSYLVHKLLGTHEEVGGSGDPMPPEEGLESDEIDAIVNWITDGALCGDPIDPPVTVYDPNDLDQEALFTCDGEPSSSPGRTRRLDHLEFRRRVGHDFKHETTANPFEPPGHLAYSTYSEGVDIDLTTLDLYFNVLSYAGQHWVGAASWSRSAWPARYDDSITCIYNDAMPDADCVGEFAERYLQSAVLHDLPDPAEVDRLTSFALDALNSEYDSGGTREATIVQITSAAWLHTNALFDTEFGAETADSNGRYRLTDWEAATLIADMVSDLGPGAAGTYLYDNSLSGDDRFTALSGGHMSDIYDAAMDGSIQSSTVAGALLRSHAMGVDEFREDEWLEYGTHSLHARQRRSSEWMADKLDRFFLEFFDVNEFEIGFQDTPQATSQFDGGPTVFYSRALDGMRSYLGYDEPDGLMLFTDATARVVVSDQEVLRGLLTTRDFYLPTTDDPSTDYSFRIFDLESPIGETRDDRWVTYPDSERARPSGLARCPRRCV